MTVLYMVVHCYYRQDLEDGWDVWATFDKVEDAIQYYKDWSESVEYGFLFIEVGWFINAQH